MRKPLIAAVNGAVAGLGLAQARFCDLWFTTAEAKFTTSFARRGLVAEYGMAWLLPRLIGRGAAMDLLLSGRIVLGDEAARSGLADRIFEPEALLPETLEYARTRRGTACLSRRQDTGIPVAARAVAAAVQAAG